MRVDITDAARRELRALGDWIARDNPTRAATFTAELTQKAVALGEFPQIYPVVRQTRRGPVRKCGHGRYLIYYLVFEDRVEVVSFRHGARDTPRFGA